MDILTLTFNGRLTKAATYKEFPEKNRAVFNFTVACNAVKDKALFLECQQWIKLTPNNYIEEQEASNDNNQELKKTVKEVLTNSLIKGANVTVHSEYMEIRKSNNGDLTKEYHNLIVNVRKVTFS